MFGQQLALNGPIGSIVRAVSLMKGYQVTVLVCFSMHLFFLMVQTAFQPFVYQYFISAWVSLVLTCVGAATIYHYCKSIYNQFYVPAMFYDVFDEDEESWKTTLRGTEALPGGRADAPVYSEAAKDVLFDSTRDSTEGEDEGAVQRRSSGQFRETMNITSELRPENQNRRWLAPHHPHAGDPPPDIEMNWTGPREK